MRHRSVPLLLLLEVLRVGGGIRGHPPGAGDDNNTEADWRQCIIQMGNHMNVGTTEWIQPNSCGFESRNSSESMRSMLFPNDLSNITVVHVGDSLAHRHFVHAVNMYYPPNTIPYTYKLHRVPNRWFFSTYDPPLPLLPPKRPTPSPIKSDNITTTSAPKSSTDYATPNTTSTTAAIGIIDRKRRMSKSVFRKGRHIRNTIMKIVEEIGDACTLIPQSASPSPERVAQLADEEGGVVEGVVGSDSTSHRQRSVRDVMVPNIVFMSYGSWDMTWKVTGELVPGLAPGISYYNITMDHVVTFCASQAERLFISVDAALRKCRSKGGLPPLVVMREQYMANCDSARYQAPYDLIFRNCSGFIVPILIPLQRRILAATAWSFNVPVIPSEHLFVPGSRCVLLDGLHMGNITCMELEHQQYWETYSHMRYMNITQGRLPNLPPFNTTSFANVTQFYEHLDLVGVGKYYRGQKYPVSYGRPEEP